MEQLIYKIGKKEYLLMDHCYVDTPAPYIDSELKDMGVIEQGVKEINQGLFTKKYVIISYLVPVNKIKEFKELMD